LAEATNLWQVFEATAARQPDASALLMGKRSVTFADLETLALRAAGLLQAGGVGKGHVVALQRGKAIETYALMLGALRLGAIYVCLDPKNPPARTQRMIERVQPRILFSEVGADNPFGERICAVHSAWHARAWPDPIAKNDPQLDLVSGDPAYIMFTSGSTGEPKGAVIPHQGVLMLMRWARDAFSDLIQRRFSAINPLHFDNSVFDFHCGLVNGGALAPVETGRLNDPADWVEALRSARANIVFAVPTLFMLLDRMGLLTPEALPDVRYFVFGGEGYPIQQLSAFRERFASSARLVNVYGPTETSCICASTEVTADSVQAAGPGFHALGRMHANFSYAVLDMDGRRTPAGETGELWIGGPAVGLGYYGDAVQTRARFRQDPRQDRFRSIFYRTGDLVRESDDGVLWFVGRADNQVKIDGHRIELEEIDLVVQSAPDVVRAASVVVRSDSSAELVVAFQAERLIAASELSAVVAAQLPQYMRPSRFVQVQDLPTNANGKIDRLAVATRAAVPASHRSMSTMQARADLEAALREIWSAVLKLDQFNGSDNFFDLGGTSMLAIQAHALIQQGLGASFSLIDFFAHPSIAGLAAFLAAAPSASDSRETLRARTARRNAALARAAARLREAE
jgi:D-alanine--poly(phosphoribitol) ligase subunit 1